MRQSQEFRKLQILFSYRGTFSNLSWSFFSLMYSVQARIQAWLKSFRFLQNFNFLTDCRIIEGLIKTLFIFSNQVKLSFYCDWRFTLNMNKSVEFISTALHLVKKASLKDCHNVKTAGSSVIGLKFGILTPKFSIHIPLGHFLQSLLENNEERKILRSQGPLHRTRSPKEAILHTHVRIGENRGRS